MQLVEKKLVSEGYCFVCGNNGFLDKDCPSCGKPARRKSFNLEDEKHASEFIEKVSITDIPERYMGVIWDSEILKESKSEKENDFSFKSFVEQLEKINGVFAGGQVLAKSAIIIAPAGYSKMVFAYSCMQHAATAGFSVAPILDTVELKRFLTLAGDNPQYKLYNKLTYEDYIMSDVLFVTVTKLPAHEWAYQSVEEILDRRTRKGLSTFVISRFSLAEISKKDYSNQFSAIALAMSADSMKYPAVIRYREPNNYAEDIHD